MPRLALDCCRLGKVANNLTVINILGGKDGNEAYARPEVMPFGTAWPKGSSHRISRGVRTIRLRTAGRGPKPAAFELQPHRDRDTCLLMCGFFYPQFIFDNGCIKAYYIYDQSDW